jgi:superfamily II DNA or RNA helicase
VNVHEDYRRFLDRKKVKATEHGIEPKGTHRALFDFQKRAVEFALRKGRAALFLDTGLGKTICQLEWARQIPGDVLILAPLAVAKQTVREAGEKLGMTVHHSRDGSVNERVTIANYERLHLFDAKRFSAVVLDESSILKSFEGKTKQRICEAFAAHPYRLACTATPAPNDHTELGQHSDFLSIMPQSHMLARWFINDTSDTGTWRLKGHAVDSFWQWVASWAVSASRPSDLGGDDTRFAMPPLTNRVHVVETPKRPNIDTGFLFGGAELSATDIHADKRRTMAERVALAAELADTGEPCVVWCETNGESEALANAIPEALEITGSDSIESKEDMLDAFSSGNARVLITKPSIAGFGLNWQHCAHCVFASLSFSFESYYQAVRRFWRFGQKREVNVDCVIADSEQGIWRAISQKMDAHQQLKTGMQKATQLA